MLFFAFLPNIPKKNREKIYRGLGDVIENAQFFCETEKKFSCRKSKIENCEILHFFYFLGSFLPNFGLRYASNMHFTTHFVHIFPHTLSRPTVLFFTFSHSIGPILMHQNAHLNQKLK